MCGPNNLGFWNVKQVRGDIQILRR